MTNAVSPPPGGRSRAKREGVAGTGAVWGAGCRRGSAPSPRVNAPRHSLACARASALFRVHPLGAVSPPPGGGDGQKGAGLAGTGAARGAGGRRGSAPSPRAHAPRHSLACACASAVFRVHARSAVSPPPGGVTGKKARDSRGYMPLSPRIPSPYPRRPSALHREPAPDPNRPVAPEALVWREAANAPGCCCWVRCGADAPQMLRRKKTTS